MDHPAKGRALLSGEFENVLLAPTCNMPGGRLGGGLANPPAWPDFLRHGQAGRPSDYPVPSADAEAELITTPFVYGGLLFHRWGHFITECPHRLWLAADRRYHDWPIAFMAAADDGKSEAWAKAAAAHLSIDPARIHVFRRGVRLARLAAGEMGKEFGIRSHPGYVAWLADRVDLSRYQDPALPKKLAVMRGHMWSGRIIGEQAIEALLTADGYAVIRPEDHSLRDQLKFYANADQIVFSEGSAIHTLDIMPPIRARVAVLQRRPLSRIAATSLEGKVADLHVLQHAARVLHPGKVQRHPFNNALSYTPLANIEDFLRGSGFLSADSAELGRSGILRGDLVGYGRALIHGAVADAWTEDEKTDQAFEDVLQAYLQQTDTLLTVRYRMHILNARLAVQRGAYTDALETLEEALKIDPNSEEAAALRGLAVAGRRRAASAVGRLQDRLIRLWRRIWSPAAATLPPKPQRPGTPSA